MPATLDATVGGLNANAYDDVTAADAYFANRLYASAWTSVAVPDLKAQALITATARLDVLPWDGCVASSTQRLQHPRIGLCDRRGVLVPSTVIAEDIRIAMFEDALDLLTKARDPGATDALARFSSVKVGSIAIGLRDGVAPTGDGFRVQVVRLIERYLAIEPPTFDRG